MLPVFDGLRNITIASVAFRLILSTLCGGIVGMEREFKRRSAKAMDACYAKCGEFGGQVSGEHAIGHAKKRYLRQSAGETAYGLMAAIKQVFDPNGILNPGKVCHDVTGGEEHA